LVAKTFLDWAVNADLWMEYSVALRNAGNLLWRRNLEYESLARTRVLKEVEDKRRRGFVLTALAQYGLSLEVGLKARLIRDRPDSVKIITVTNGRGVVTEASLERVGVSLDAGHALEDLAQSSGFLKKDNHSLCAKLRALEMVVIWAGRYPVPRSLGKAGRMTKYGVLYPDALREAAVRILDELHRPYAQLLEP
jgi:hypothetical protein